MTPHLCRQGRAWALACAIAGATVLYGCVFRFDTIVASDGGAPDAGPATDSSADVVAAPELGTPPDGGPTHDGPFATYWPGKTLDGRPCGPATQGQPCETHNACAVGGVCEGTFCVSRTLYSCNDGRKCTDDYCVPGPGACGRSLVPGHCLLPTSADGPADSCFEEGAKFAGGACATCKPSTDPLSWTIEPGHCFIEMICYPAGAKGEACDICDPAQDVYGWSHDPGCVKP